MQNLEVNGRVLYPSSDGGWFAKGLVVGEKVCGLCRLNGFTIRQCFPEHDDQGRVTGVRVPQDYRNLACLGNVAKALPGQ
jgi:hypothetical protein